VDRKRDDVAGLDIGQRCAGLLEAGDRTAVDLENLVVDLKPGTGGR
jgi:hypothetical protein